jgi:hypothetical protein
MSTVFPQRARHAPGARGVAFPTSTPALRRLAEMIYLRVYNGLGAGEYESLGLGRRSLSWAEKREFVGKRWYAAMIDGINPPEFRIAAWNKVVTGAILRAFSLPSPRIYGTVSPANGTACDGQPLRTSTDLAALIERFALQRACFKLVGGWSGRGFMDVTFEAVADGGIVVHVSGEDRALDLDRFWSERIENLENSGASLRQRQFGYFCQARVDSHPDIAAFNPPSLNTLRVWMAQRRRGQWTMEGTVLRMGTGEMAVDNGAAGGIGSPVAPDTGILGPAVRRGRRGIEYARFDHHPSSGLPISGARVPHWDAVAPLCRQACAAFPYFRFMGIDVAVTPSGPIVIEVEADPHQSHQAHLGRGMRSLLIDLARASYRDQH